MHKRASLLGLLVVLCAILFLGKPLRVFAPRFAGVSCLSPTMCLEDTTRLAEASHLYEASLAQIQSILGNVQKRPRVIFCSTDECYQRFGFRRSAAMTVGTAAIVVSPRGWKPHYLRHEMVHHLQNERLGTFRMMLKPQWFREGMAYALSGDPRAELIGPSQEYRARFNEWRQKLGSQDLWSAARGL